MKKKLIILISLVFFAGLGVKSAAAICPVCTVAVTAGVCLSRWLGIDDIISGLWIGGFAVSMIYWTLGWLDKKNYRFRGRTVATVIAYFAMITIPLYYAGLLGSPLEIAHICGIDRLLVGIIVGSLGFWSTAEWYYYLKAKNNDRAHFPYQKVAMPVGILLLLSLIYYFLT